MPKSKSEDTANTHLIKTLKRKQEYLNRVKVRTLIEHFIYHKKAVGKKNKKILYLNYSVSKILWLCRIILIFVPYNLNLSQIIRPFHFIWFFNIIIKPNFGKKSSNVESTLGRILTIRIQFGYLSSSFSTILMDYY